VWIFGCFFSTPTAILVKRSSTSTQKSGRLGDITIPGFVPLQEFCSPIRLQHLSVCLHWTLKCCNLIGLQNSCGVTNPGIVTSPNLLLFRVEVGLCPTTAILEQLDAYNYFYCSYVRTILWENDFCMLLLEPSHVSFLVVSTATGILVHEDTCRTLCPHASQCFGAVVGTATH